MNKLEQALNFFCENEVATFQQSEYYSKLCELANKLNYHVNCSSGVSLEDNRKIYLEFSIKDSNNDTVYVDDLDYEHLCDATCIIEFDKNFRYKFNSWENDADFIDSVLWVIKELEIKSKN